MDAVALVGWSCVALIVLPTGFAPITFGRGVTIDVTQLTKLQSAMGLPLTTELASPVLARMRLRERWALRVGLAGIAIGALLSVLLQPTSPSGVLIMMGAALGGAIGSGFATVRSAYRLPEGVPRLARVKRTRISDYVPTAHLVAARGMLALALAANGVELFLSVSEGRPASAVPVVSLACVAIALPVAIASEVMMRQVVDLPQPATADIELAWDDVLRADAVHHLLLNQILVCGFAALAAPLSAGLLAGGEPMPPTTTVVSGAIIVAATIGALVTVSAGAWRRRPLHRLWSGRSFTAEDVRLDSEPSSEVSSC